MQNSGLYPRLFEHFLASGVGWFSEVAHALALECGSPNQMSKPCERVLCAVSKCFAVYTRYLWSVRQFVGRKRGGDGASENAKRTIQIYALVRVLCMAECLTNSFCKLLRAKPDVIQPCIEYLLLSISLLNIHIIIWNGGAGVDQTGWYFRYGTQRAFVWAVAVHVGDSTFTASELCHIY